MRESVRSISRTGQGRDGEARTRERMGQEGIRTVEDGMAPIQAKSVLHLFLARGFGSVLDAASERSPNRLENTYSAVRHPAVSSHERCRAEILILIPPITRATRATTSTQNTLIHSIELLTLLRRLEVFAFFWGVVVLEVRFDGLVLFVE